MKARVYRALLPALLLRVMPLLLLLRLQVLQVQVLSSLALQALPSNCWHVRPRLLWYQPHPGKRELNNTQSVSVSANLSTPLAFSVLHLVGRGGTVGGATDVALLPHALDAARASCRDICHWRLGGFGVFVSLWRQRMDLTTFGRTETALLWGQWIMLSSLTWMAEVYCSSLLPILETIGVCDTLAAVLQGGTTHFTLIRLVNPGSLNYVASLWYHTIL